MVYGIWLSRMSLCGVWPMGRSRFVTLFTSDTRFLLETNICGLGLEPLGCWSVEISICNYRLDLCGHNFMFASVLCEESRVYCVLVSMVYGIFLLRMALCGVRATGRSGFCYSLYLRCTWFFLEMNICGLGLEPSKFWSMENYVWNCRPNLCGHSSKNGWLGALVQCWSPVDNMHLNWLLIFSTSYVILLTGFQV